MDKIKILDEIDFDTGSLMTSFEKASKILIKEKDRLESEGWSSVHLKLERYYGDCRIIVKGMRLEHDSEFNKRVKAKEKQELRKKRKLESERKKYEKLKEKFS